MAVKIKKNDPTLVYYGPHPCQKCDPKGARGTMIVKAGNGAPDDLEFDYPDKNVDTSKRENWKYPNQKSKIVWKKHKHLK